VLARDGYCCTRCHERRPAHELDVHHIIPRALGGTDHPANLTTLCDGCHAAKHPSLQVSLARRFLERWGVRIARWLDQTSRLPGEVERIGAAMRVLGVERLREGQLEVILAALRGESVLFVSATGSGKSLCFQVPALLADRGTVVVSPLKALMTDQVASLTERGLPVTFLNSSLSKAETDARLSLLRAGAVKLVYVTPERLDPTRRRYGRDVVLHSNPAFLVVDEAHCVDRWGESFRPSYLELGGARKAMGSPPVLAFTATASPVTRDRILGVLGATVALRVVMDVDRPNITYLRAPSLRDTHAVMLVEQLLKVRHGGRTMVFVQTRRRGEELQHLLRQRGFDIPFYHAKLPASDREFLQQRFSGRLEPHVSTIICTNAFGMGIDVPDVRLVVHWGMSGSPSDYAQEVGRAGRDRRSAVGVLVPRPKDMELQHFMLERSAAATEADNPDGDGAMYLKRRRDEVSTMLGMAMSRDRCLRQLLAEHFGGRPEEAPASLAVRLLRWLYRARSDVTQEGWCCDACAKARGLKFMAMVEGALAGEPPADQRRSLGARLSGRLLGRSSW
jgi:ATP-dependent DNA helicase RecQ